MSPKAPTQVCDRPETIEEMISGVERYNPDNLPFLEEYLEKQCGEDKYDILANTAILELYQFNPSLINLSVVTTILGKSLTAFPDADFNMFLSLLSNSVAAEATITLLLNLQQALEECRFKKFWELRSLPEYSSVLASIKGFDHSIRNVIARSLSITFQSLPKNLALVYLNLSETEVKTFASEFGWEFNSTDILLNPSSLVADSKPGVIQHHIQLEQLSTLITQSAVLESSL